jgi:hypothetical protein
MGRYYSGDIEGKFWFGLQSSNCGERFGATESTQIINYYCDDLKMVKTELKAIRLKLENKLKILNKFFKENKTYSNDKISELGINRNELADYADYLFGLKLKKMIIKQGYCSYEAEI